MLLIIKRRNSCAGVCVLINSTRLHFRNSKWQWMRLLLSKSEMKSRNDVEQTRGTRQLIQSGLTRLQSQQPHQLLCPKMDERGSKTETKQRQNSSKEETSLIDTALCWLDVGRMCCHSGINGLRRLVLHCVVVNGIMSYSPTSESPI